MSLISPDLQTRFAQLQQIANAIIHRHAQPDMATELKLLSQSVSADECRDSYGKGGIIADFEAQLADLFAKPASAFLPTGTLAQCAALKHHSSTTGKQGVALHPTSHLLLHEHMAVETLWGLTATPMGSGSQVLSAVDVTALDADGLGAVVIETPMREIGGAMPTWQALCDIRTWCDQHNVKLHLDGARIWQARHFYQRSLANIAALFDSVYVSFYKDLGGIFGAGLLADTTAIEQARIWSRRAGGNPITLYPEVLAARRGLATFLPQTDRFVRYSMALAQALVHAPVTLLPASPQAAMFHVRIDMDPQSLAEHIVAYAAQSQVIPLPLPRSGDSAHSMCEISVGDQALTRPPAFWAAHITACLTMK
ncbi:threonine aldolase family protein [Alteromonas halophila]|uniref:Aromatic amino acid beta-eliminating lyase/threonine aldolase domain-containing protein n=1 Tax=Alteromonas halophila TaxID=516698 RepID=A0A918JGU1_9ALTE|nr:beta-eliminating lyase-related protein [Alteromonas halophila]GGW77926.1 hypothetical protein GCM10007391_08100 [Alteromonas halophila]